MKEVLIRIVQAFDLGKILSHDQVTEGVLNQNYLLETEKGGYFIKGIRGKVADKVGYIYEVESFMKEVGVPAVQMLETISGDITVTIDDTKYSVYPFIESDRSHCYSKEDYIRIGEMLGRIHAVSYGKEIGKLADRKLWGRRDDEIIEKLKEYKKQIEVKTDREDIDNQFFEFINLKLSLVENWNKIEDLPNDTLAHGDYHAGNLLIDKSTREIVGICDWEKSEYSPRSYELGRSMLYLGFDGNNENEHGFEVVKYFLQGYRKVIQISTDEIIHGLKMRLTRHIITCWIENMHYADNNTRADHFIKNEIRILKLFVIGNGLERIKEIG